MCHSTLKCKSSRSRLRISSATSKVEGVGGKVQNRCVSGPKWLHKTGLCWSSQYCFKFWCHDRCQDSAKVIFCFWERAENDFSLTVSLVLWLGWKHFILQPDRGKSINIEICYSFIFFFSCTSLQKHFTVFRNIMRITRKAQNNVSLKKTSGGWEVIYKDRKALQLGPTKRNIELIKKKKKLLTGLECWGIDLNLASCDWLEDREFGLVEVWAGGEARVRQTPLLGFLLLIHRHQLKRNTHKQCGSSFLECLLFVPSMMNSVPYEIQCEANCSDRNT